MDRSLGSWLGAALIALLLVGPLQAQQRNHSFDVYDVVVTASEVTFTASPSASSALNMPMEARVCDSLNSTTFTGETHTFTSVSETFSYTVDISAGGFSGNDNVIVSVTDQAGTTDCNAGTEGYISTYPLGFGMSVGVPTLSVGGIALLILLMAGLVVAQRKTFIG